MITVPYSSPETVHDSELRHDGSIGSSNLLRDAKIEAAGGAELRREHADAGAVPDLVDLVEHVHHVEPQRGRLGRRDNVEIMRYAHIDLGIGRHVIGIGETRP